MKEKGEKWACLKLPESVIHQHNAESLRLRQIARVDVVQSRLDADDGAAELRGVVGRGGTGGTGGGAVALGRLLRSSARREVMRTRLRRRQGKA